MINYLLQIIIKFILLLKSLDCDYRNFQKKLIYQNFDFKKFKQFFKDSLNKLLDHHLMKVFNYLEIQITDHSKILISRMNYYQILHYIKFNNLENMLMLLNLLLRIKSFNKIIKIITV